MPKYNKFNRGTAAIELTIILPFMLMLILAIAEFGRLLYQYNALNHLVRDALRYAVHDVRDGDTVVSTAAVLAIKTRTERLLYYGEDSVSEEPIEILPNISNAEVLLTKIEDNYVQLTVTYYWQPLFSSTLENFSSSTSINLSFPLSVNYTMRAL